VLGIRPATDRDGVARADGITLHAPAGPIPLDGGPQPGLPRESQWQRASTNQGRRRGCSGCGLRAAFRFVRPDGPPIGGRVINCENASSRLLSSALDARIQQVDPHRAQHLHRKTKSLALAALPGAPEPCAPRLHLHPKKTELALPQVARPAHLAALRSRPTSHGIGHNLQADTPLVLSAAGRVQGFGPRVRYHIIRGTLDTSCQAPAPSRSKYGTKAKPRLIRARPVFPSFLAFLPSGLLSRRNAAEKRRFHPDPQFQQPSGLDRWMARLMKALAKNSPPMRIHPDAFGPDQTPNRAPHPREVFETAVPRHFPCERRQGGSVRPPIRFADGSCERARTATGPAVAGGDFFRGSATAAACPRNWRAN